MLKETWRLLTYPRLRYTVLLSTMVTLEMCRPLNSQLICSLISRRMRPSYTLVYRPHPLLHWSFRYLTGGRENLCPAAFQGGCRSVHPLPSHPNNTSKSTSSSTNL